MWTNTVQKQIDLKKGIAKLPHWVSDFFLFFFRKDGVRNFFFFFEGDLFGDSSLPWSPAASSPATGSSPSGGGAESVSPGAGSSTGRAATSEASSGVRSGRVCLKVAASLSSLNVCSCCASVEDEGKDHSEFVDQLTAWKPSKGKFSTQKFGSSCMKHEKSISEKLTVNLKYLTDLQTHTHL